MSSSHLLALVGGAFSLTLIVELMRRRQIKEKYAVLWIVVSIGIVALAVWPELLDISAAAVGVKSGPSLLLFVAGLVLLVVCVHLSWEVSRLEDKSRAVAEELGLLRLELEKHERTAPPTVTGSSLR